MSRIVALTGTPGTGKTAVAAALRARGLEVLDINALAREAGALAQRDARRDTWEVDLRALGEALAERALSVEGTFISEGHLAHLLECDLIVVLRCEPDVLRRRLEERGYTEAKVDENVWAEALGVISAESRETNVPVFEVDTTSSTVEGTALAVLHAIGDGVEGSVIDWSEWIMDNA
ncbi:MAG: adenylate kinase family protein [Thermoplasmata archaeon]|nr:adenylate kinase family protein [Thermoplasmata archaeon]